MALNNFVWQGGHYRAAHSELMRIVLNFRHQFTQALDYLLALTTDDIKQIAHLARIGLDESAIEPLREDISTVLTLVEQLNAVDTNGVEPLAHPGQRGFTSARRQGQ